MEISAEAYAVRFTLNDTLGIELENEDLKSLETVGELYDLVAQRVGPLAPPKRMACSMFYPLRRALCEACGVQRGDVRLDTDLGRIFNRWRFRRQWRAVRQALKTHVRPIGGKGDAWGFLWFMAGAVGLFGAPYLPKVLAAIVVLAALAALMMGIVYKVYPVQPWTLMPNSPETVRDLTRLLRAVAVYDKAERRQQLTATELWVLVVGVLEDWSCAGLPKVRRDTRLEEDLKL
jgi:hypothetical protein